MKQFALFGNPNTGKTSLFNIITGSYEYVGNWSGVTVEKKIGKTRGSYARIVDLPGIYSINPISSDEAVAVRYLMEEAYAGVVNIVDASQLERNLYLTVQLMEFGQPMIVALNMVDVARVRGIEVDIPELEKRLGIPVCPVVARTGDGCDALLRKLDEGWREGAALRIDYGPLEAVIERIAERLGAVSNGRWMAIQLMEGNAYVADKARFRLDSAWLGRTLEEAASRIREVAGSRTLAQYIREIRARWIQEVLLASTVVKRGAETNWTERIDNVVTSRFLGIPIFLASMFTVFKLTFDWLGSPLSDGLDRLLSGPVTDGAEKLLSIVGATPFIRDLVVQGIIGGVGGVLVFVPQIFILFFLISFIEDSGYMARIAMVMDRLMEAIGLNGKAFIPMIIGFGCNVPGIMAARSIEQPKERLLTILLTPLMSCSARLSVYSLFVAAFFASNQSAVVFSLYVLGIALALGLARLFSATLVKHEGSIFLVELPPYRAPQWRTLRRSTWEKGKGFIKKAGTFIFGGSVLIWLLSYAGPQGLDVEMNDSFLAMIGGWMAPLLAPLGFGTWQAGAALMTGFMAKEVVVSTMNIIYGAADTYVLQETMAQFFTPLQAYSFMAFVLLYVPCLATVAVVSKETGSAKWTGFSILYGLAIAYLVSIVIYQGGRFIGLGG